jgi:hypothetical protein
VLRPRAFLRYYDGATRMSSRARTTLRHSVLLTFLVIVFAAPALRNGFVFDDTQMIVDGHVIHEPRRALEVFRHSTMWVSDEGSGRAPSTQGLQTYRPITLLTFFADAAIWGKNPLGYHLTNVLLHVVCVLLLRAICVRVIANHDDEWSPTIAAAWFALSPLLAEAYVWINGRSDPLAMAFGFGGWLVYLRARDRGDVRRPHLGAVALLWLAGLLSKEVLLFALPVFVAWPGLTRRERAGVFVTVATAACGYLAVRAAVFAGLATHNDAQQLARAAMRLALVWLDGIVSLIVPNRIYLRLMADEYEALGPTAAIVAWCIVIAAAVGFALRGRRVPWLRWALGFHAAALLPVALIAALAWPGFGRYLYLPAGALAVAFASAVHAVHRRLADAPARTRRLAVAAVLLYLGALGARLTLWSLAWHDEPALYEQAIADAPDRAGGHGWLGEYLLDHGRAAEALPLLVEANERWHGDRHVLESAARAATLVDDRAAAWRIAQTGIDRFHPAGPFYLVGAWARRDEPTVASDLLARCLGEGDDAIPCVRAVQSLVAGARGHEYREAFARWCDAHRQDRAVARIRALLAPRVERAE